ncbi:DJC28 protein, partial [Polyodon spathula]|nr:DJC28 protein [Polyodon spathula]
MGTPSQRERQYRQFRVDRAMDQVLDYRRRSLEHQSSEDALTASEVRRTKNIKITQAIERLVEDLIQESMVKGDFSNLSGKGKPLSKFSHSNPYVDPMTHNLNRILIENGYQPQWIVAHKEIRETIAQLRADLLVFRVKLGEPLTPSKQKQWLLNCEAFRADLARLNKRVDGFNLIVPLLSQQMVHFSAERELKRALQAYQELREEQRNSEEKAGTGETGDPKGGLFTWVQNLFK